jgi:hypothetical protein
MMEHPVSNAGKGEKRKTIKSMKAKGLAFLETVSGASTPNSSSLKMD